MQDLKDSKLLAMTLGGVLFLALMFVTSPAWAATPTAPYVTNANQNGGGNYTLTGTAEPGSLIRVTGGESTVLATTTFGGIWSVMVDVEESDDLSDLRIVSTNSLGETSSVTRLNDDGTVLFGNGNDNDSGDDDNDDGEDNNDSNGEVTALVLPGIVYTQ